MSEVANLSCDNYAFLLVAGPYRKDMPEKIRELMNEHERTCRCMDRKGYNQSLLGVGVTESMEAAAKKLMEKLDKQATLG